MSRSADGMCIFSNSMNLVAGDLVSSVERVASTRVRKQREYDYPRGCARMENALREYLGKSVSLVMQALKV